MHVETCLKFYESNILLKQNGTKLADFLTYPIAEALDMFDFLLWTAVSSKLSDNDLHHLFFMGIVYLIPTKTGVLNKLLQEPRRAEVLLSLIGLL